MGTILENSKFPLRLWLQAIHLLCTSKKGMSGRQLRLTLGCGAKTAWHLRMRFAMDQSGDIGPSGLAVFDFRQNERRASYRSSLKRLAGKRLTHRTKLKSLTKRMGPNQLDTANHGTD
jgi:hypothetical protein